jgi:nuclease S1
MHGSNSRAYTRQYRRDEVLERDCSDKSCVVEQINLDEAILRDPEATYAAKAETLMFLVHFVGDVHQPLHLGRATDRGGNSIEVHFAGSKTNFHRLWDSGLINHTGLNRDKYLAGLMRLAGKMEPGSLDPVDWANESLKLAYSNAYAIPKNGKLGDAYYGQNIIVVNQRLAIAGVRLAAVLNDIYDPADVEPTPSE